MNITFENLRESTLEEVAILYDAERPINTNREKMKKTWEQLKDNPDYKMIVVKNNKEVVGFAYVIIHHDIFEENNPFITIWSVRVKKEYRRKGVATKLFQYIENQAKEKNCEFISLIAVKNNERANIFYKSRGFKKENGYIKSMKE